jgi:hypothetical protein
MPIHKRAPDTSKFSSAPSLAGVCVELQFEEGIEEFGAHLPVQGEIIQSFEIADTPGGWHLVWLDEAFEFDGQVQAHLMIGARWVARPIKAGSPAPISIRLVPDVALVQRGAPDVEKLPLVAKGSAVVV